MHEDLYGDEDCDVDSEDGIHFCDDESLAAGIAYDLEDELGSSVVVFGTAAGSSCRLAHAHSVHALRWLPGTHTLLVLGNACIGRIDVDAASPELEEPLGLLWSAMAAELPQDMHAFLEIVPDGSAAALLDSTPSPEGRQVVFALFDATSLAQTSSQTFIIKAAGSEVPYHSSLHVSTRAVAACFRSYGTRVWSLSKGQLGKGLFTAQGLEGVSFSQDGLFMAGLQGGAHVLLETRTGSRLLKLAFTPSPLHAMSIAWAAGDSGLHLGFCSPPDSVCSCVMWMILGF